MLTAQAFCDKAKDAGFLLYTGVPCSYVKPLINFVIEARDLEYVAATNEGDAVAIASGAALAGARSIVMMQNSGLGNAVSPLASLNAVFRVPVLLIVTLRGEPGGPHDEPQHQLMGAITTALLEKLNVAWDWFPTEEAQLDGAINKAVAHMEEAGLPFCFVMRKDSVAPFELTSAPQAAGAAAAAIACEIERRPTRADALRAIQRGADPQDLLVATTGYTARELYACEDRPNQFYVVGSMGCASSIALGLALQRPDRRVVVIDGDGAMLMRLGALTTLAYARPANLVHVLLDNEAYESTGGQATVSHAVDLARVAEACGYERVFRLTTADGLETLLKDREPGLRLASLKIRPGVGAQLPRPTVTPPEVARRIMRTLERRE